MSWNGAAIAVLGLVGLWIVVELIGAFRRYRKSR